MPFVSEIGEASESHGEVFIEWKIKNFFSLSEKPDDFYRSPVFNYSDAVWHLVLYPNGQTRNQSTGWLDLYLARKDSGLPKFVNFTLWIKDSDAGEINLQSKFSNTQAEFGQLKYYSRSDLLNRKVKIMPFNILTVYCKIKSNFPNAVASSLFSRLRKVSSNLQTILVDGKSADFTLRCKGREWPVHKIILGSRCEYFETMFRHEWMETSAGEVQFSNIDEEALDSVLHFIYTGEVEDLLVRNVFSLYITAHLFLLKDLKEMCIEFMKRNMGIDVICDALEIAYTYDEEDLKEHSVKYFVENADEILEKDEWKRLKEKNSSLTVKILELTASNGAKCHKRIKLMKSVEIAPQSGSSFVFGTPRASLPSFSFSSLKR